MIFRPGAVTAVSFAVPKHPQCCCCLLLKQNLSSSWELNGTAVVPSHPACLGHQESSSSGGFSQLCLSPSHTPGLEASDPQEPLWEGFWPWQWGHQGSPQVEILVQASTGRKLPFENLKFLPLMDLVTNPKPQPAAHTAGVTLRHNSSGQKGEIPTEAVIPWVPLMLKYKSGVRALH